MGTAELHDLTPAYALDALDDHEREAYELHLRACERCRVELASLSEAAGALAYAVDAPAPPPALRERILEQARAERPNVVPLASRRPRLRWPRLSLVPAAAAAAAAVVALVLGGWALALRGELEETREALERRDGVAALLADPEAQTIRLSGAAGRLVIAPDGRAALLVSGLDGAPSGHRYEMWVIEAGKPRSAGTFDTQDGRAVAELGRALPDDATFAVTLEPVDGGAGPDTAPLFTATA